jgi:hypothetical protein
MGGTMAVCRILNSVLAADTPASGGVLRGGDWDAAVQRLRWPPAVHKTPLDALPRAVIPVCCDICRISIALKWTTLLHDLGICSRRS